MSAELWLRMSNLEKLLEIERTESNRLRRLNASLLRELEKNTQPHDPYPKGEDL